MKTICGTCGKAIDVRPYRLRAGRVFCSNLCQRTNPEVVANRAAKRRTGEQRTCPVCGVTFYRKRAELRAVNYCSYACAGRASIERGDLRPAPKGVRRSPATEFTSGAEPANKVPVGTVRIRTRHGRGGEQRFFVKVAEPNGWRERARVVWEEHHGPIPKGHLIHHDNRDPLDDRIDNLRCLTRAEHAAEHALDGHLHNKSSSVSA